jgi:hypothetical protein
MMAMPAHLGRRPRFVLHRPRGTWIDQRHRLRALDRSGENEQRSSGRKAEHFQGLHFGLIS